MEKKKSTGDNLFVLGLGLVAGAVLGFVGG